MLKAFLNWFPPSIPIKMHLFLTTLIDFPKLKNLYNKIQGYIYTHTHTHTHTSFRNGKTTNNCRILNAHWHNINTYHTCLSKACHFVVQLHAKLFTQTNKPLPWNSHDTNRTINIVQLPIFYTNHIISHSWYNVIKNNYVQIVIYHRTTPITSSQKHWYNEKWQSMF